VRLIEAGANLGFAAGNNLAAAQALGDWLALINPDAFAAPDWLERLLEAAAPIRTSRPLAAARTWTTMPAGWTAWETS